jgi:hypothetical protein
VHTAAVQGQIAVFEATNSTRNDDSKGRDRLPARHQTTRSARSAAMSLAE